MIRVSLNKVGLNSLLSKRQMVPSNFKAIHRHLSTAINVEKPSIQSEIHNIKVVDKYHNQTFKPISEFSNLPLVPQVKGVLTGTKNGFGFDAPTPIQSQSWPILLENRDVISIAKTGSGKYLYKWIHIELIVA